MAYAKNRKRIGFALTPEEYEWLEKYMEFYKCKSYGDYFKLKLRTDMILFENDKEIKNGIIR